VMEPVIGYALFTSIDALANVVRLFTERCVWGIQANRERCEELVNRSIGLVTAINPIVGYKNASEIAREAALTGRPVREIVLEKGLLTEEEIDEILSPKNLTTMGIARRVRR